MDDRYSRQKLFSPIGKEGQKKIMNKHVLIVGVGALGTASAEGLVRAGIGKLTIVDRDYVEWSNLQRQQLYDEEDAERKTPKAIAAKQRLRKVNANVEIISHVIDGTVEKLEPILHDVHLIIDATDNFDSRMILNDLSQKHDIPWIYGACVGSYGMSYTIIPGKTPCLHCLLEHIPVGGMTCDTAGIISPAVQMVVAYQISEALKILVEDKESLRETLVSFDLWKNQYTAVKVGKVKKATCLSCGDAPTYPFLSYENQMKTEVLCGRDTVQIRPPKPVQYDLKKLEDQLSNKGKVERNPYLMSFTTESFRLVIFRDGRVFVHGTKDIKTAKTLYHRYLG
ncbi:thiazole biosynthesis adenylyltransferase ThiF [Bacillus alveayuensis]|uniref:thiazole biosynthesis adenylyltransferase ThiF n=1 Tax=Aeribacillus alveayuensis TaxID=279215 RepID=UPI0005D12F94|nr:thiazole biosynthesis adenylyltransferase ThiF [Bacillus alveayuensis]